MISPRLANWIAGAVTVVWVLNFANVSTSNAIQAGSNDSCSIYVHCRGFAGSQKGKERHRR